MKDIDGDWHRQGEKYLCLCWAAFTAENILASASRQSEQESSSKLPPHHLYCKWKENRKITL